VSRVLAEKLSPALGQQILVENRAGAGDGSPAINGEGDAGRLHAPRGAGAALVTVRALLAGASYDPIRARAHLPGNHHRTARGAPSVPAGSVKQLIAVAKSRPGSLTTLPPAAAARPAAAELFSRWREVKLIHVPYKGARRERCRSCKLKPT
jgi:tripartite-type tricarboxylate transporter receptor subunit TctC